MARPGRRGSLGLCYLGKLILISGDVESWCFLCLYGLLHSGLLTLNCQNVESIITWSLMVKCLTGMFLMVGVLLFS